MADNFFGITDLGKERQNNEDTFIAQQGANDRYIIACVIDGVGGYSGGEIAAEIARETIVKHLDSLPLGASPEPDKIIAVLVGAFNIADEKIREQKQSDKQHSSMACVLTLAVVDIAANQFYYAHLGDTRLYLLRDGSLVKITHDQSFVGFLEESGRLNETEAMRHPKRNEIDKALGFKPLSAHAGDVETGHSPFLPGDMLLLCSDGLTDVVDKAAITQIMTGSSSLKTIAGQLVDAANNGGGKDNITAVLVKNDKAAQQYAAARPAESAQPPKAAMIDPEKKTAKNSLSATATQPVKTYKGWAILLLILVIGLAGLSAWQYINYSDKETVPVPKQVVAAPVERKPNAQEIKLQAAIDNAKGKMLVLSDTAFKSPVVITRPIIINRDSLYIKAKGNITFQSDSGFLAPAFILTAKTKSIMLDSLVFQNFNVAVSGFNQSLQLKNVRFKNCKTPVENNYGLADGKYVNGIVGAVPFKTDSLPKIN